MKQQLPDAKQMAKFQREEARFADFHGETLVFGDSRAKQWPTDQLHSLGLGSVCNMGVTVDTVQYALWRAGHTAVDLSHVTSCVVEIGINNLNRNPSDSPADIAAGIARLAHILEGKIAPGAHVYVVEVFEEREKGYETDGDRQALNAEIQARAGNHFTYVALPDMDPANTDDYRIDGTHLTSAGYADFLTPALAQAMDAVSPAMLEPPTLWDHFAI